MAHAVDLLVDRAFLLDVGVGARHVGFGLVVVVVGDEVLDRVVGEEALELAVELGGQRLVGGEHECRPLRRRDHLRHGVGLARAGDAEQHLAALVFRDAGDELGDRGRLVALGLILGDELEAHAAFRLLRPRRTVRGEQRLVAGDERVRRQHRLLQQHLLGPRGALGGLGQQRVEVARDRLPRHGWARPLLAQRRQRRPRRLAGIEGRLWRLGEGAGLRRAGGGLGRWRGRLAGLAARGARLRGRIGLGLRGAGHAPNMACAALPLKPAASAVGRPAGALRAACARFPGRNPSRCPRSGPHRPASP